MGRGESDQTKAGALSAEANALAPSARRASTQPPEMFSRLHIELKDPESGIAETLNSTYTLEVPTESGPLHMLFRLDNGDPQRPEIARCVLGGQQVEVESLATQQAVTLACEAAPWLFWDE